MKTLLLICLIGAILKSYLSDDTCTVDKKPHLQVAFVATYVVNWLRSEEGKYLNTTAQLLMKKIQAEFPTAEFALTGFVDYPDTAMPDERIIYANERCYFLMKEFTKEPKDIIEKLNVRVTQRNDTNRDWSNANQSESQSDSFATALLMTASEKNLTWKNGFHHGENIVRKILIPLTRRPITTKLKSPGRRTVPKADGSDTCSNSLPPTYEQLNRVLFERGFFICNSLWNSKETGSHESHYTKYFSRFYIPYFQHPFPGSGRETSQRIKGSKNLFNYDYENYTNLMFKSIYREVMSCEWEDPTGYNTLAL